MLDVNAIISEIKAGLPHENDRRQRASDNLAFYRGDFSAHMPCLANDAYGATDRVRTSLLMQRTILTLTQHLYAKGPAREFPNDPDLTAWLAEQYQREVVDGLLQEADRYALTAQVAAIQVVGPDEDGDPVEAAYRPVRFQLWDANSFVVWLDPNDPTKAAAIATIDMFDCQRRLRLWTADERYTFLTEKQGPGQTAGGTAYYQDGEPVENYYGMLPFAFVHANVPSTDFWNHCPGDNLCQANDYINFDLTDLGDSLGYARKPLLTEFGNESEPPKPIRPGDRWKLTGRVTSDGVGIPPELDYLQPDLGFVDACWTDLQSYIDHTLLMIGCPPATIRLAGDPSKSGFALLVEQQPLVDWAASRQRGFAAYEQQLARATIAVGAAELDRLNLTTKAKLDPLAAYSLALRWPSMRTEVPMTAAEQTAQDASDLEMGLTSKIKIIMRRQSLSREQAIAYLQSVTRDLVEESTLSPQLANSFGTNLGTPDRGENDNG